MNVTVQPRNDGSTSRHRYMYIYIKYMYMAMLQSSFQPYPECRMAASHEPLPHSAPYPDQAYAIAISKNRNRKDMHNTGIINPDIISWYKTGYISRAGLSTQAESEDSKIPTLKGWVVTVPSFMGKNNH
eukprot:scpid102280/ scgid17132/ 